MAMIKTPRRCREKLLTKSIFSAPFFQKWFKRQKTGFHILFRKVRDYMNRTYNLLASIHTLMFLIAPRVSAGLYCHGPL